MLHTAPRRSKGDRRSERERATAGDACSQWAKGEYSYCQESRSSPQESRGLTDVIVGENYMSSVVIGRASLKEGYGSVRLTLHGKVKYTGRTN